MAYTQSQLEALEKAYASGTTRVTYGDKTVEYRDLLEIKRIISEIRAEISGAPRRRRWLTSTRGDKGL